MQFLGVKVLILFYKGLKMNFKRKLLSFVAVATLAVSGQASAIQNDGGGELFLVASNGVQSFVATFARSVADFTGSSSQSFDLSGSAWTSYVNASQGNANQSTNGFANTTYQVLGVNLDNEKIVTTLNPLVSSAGSNQQLENAFASAGDDASPIYGFLKFNNGDVTGLSTAFRATGVAGGMAEMGANWATTIPNINTTQTISQNISFASFSYGASQIAVTPFDGVWNLSNSGTLNYTVAAVPEADASLMMLAGVLAMGVVARRRRSI